MISEQRKYFTRNRGHDNTSLHHSLILKSCPLEFSLLYENMMLTLSSGGCIIHRLQCVCQYNKSTVETSSMDTACQGHTIRSYSDNTWQYVILAYLLFLNIISFWPTLHHLMKYTKLNTTKLCSIHYISLRSFSHRLIHSKSKEKLV